MNVWLQDSFFHKLFWLITKLSPLFNNAKEDGSPPSSFVFKPFSKRSSPEQIPERTVSDKLVNRRGAEVLARLQHAGGKGGNIDGIGEKLRLEADTGALCVAGAPLAVFLHDEIAGIHLHTRQIRVYLHGAAAGVLGYLGHFFYFPFSLV